MEQFNRKSVPMAIALCVLSGLALVFYLLQSIFEMNSLVVMSVIGIENITQDIILLLLFLYWMKAAQKKSPELYVSTALFLVWLVDFVISFALGLLPGGFRVFNTTYYLAYMIALRCIWAGAFLWLASKSSQCLRVILVIIALLILVSLGLYIESFVNGHSTTLLAKCLGRLTMFVIGVYFLMNARKNKETQHPHSGM